MNNALVISNDKGGVGKTSVSTAVAAHAAKLGIRTLLVDLDRQGNAASRFGLQEHDEGKALMMRVMEEDAAPTRDVRPNLDMFPAGRWTEAMLDGLERAVAKTDRSALAGLGECLDPIAADYDLVVFDTPLDHTMIDAALIAGTWLVLPTKTGDNDLGGMWSIAQRCADLRSRELTNISLAGIALFDVDASAKKIRSEVRGMVDAALGGTGHVYETIIRHSQASAKGMVRLGLTFHEYAERAASVEPWYKRLDADAKDAAQHLASPAAAKALAADYEKLANEILQSLIPVEAAPETTSGGAGTTDTVEVVA